MSAQLVRGLYAIIDTSITTDTELLARATAAISGGATTLQYRDKSSDQNKRHAQALALSELCHRLGIQFIVNDDYQLAAQVRADGVHLGEEDGQLQIARDHLGDHAIIGISCYDQLVLAQQAQDRGADYVAFGRCFPSTTKPGERYVTLEQISRARQQLTIPLVGIGGINAANARGLRLAGIDAVAVIGALFAVSDSEAAAREICVQMADL